MKTGGRRWVKWLLVGSGLVILIPLAAYGVFMLIVAAWLLSPDEVGIGIRQDCAGVQITVSGEVRDPNGLLLRGVHIYMSKLALDPDDRIVMRFTTDDEGRFQTEQPFSLFYCEELYFEVEAEGSYERTSLTYSLVDNYSEENFPAQPVPIRLNFTLVEKIEVTDEADNAV